MKAAGRSHRYLRTLLWALGWVFQSAPGPFIRSIILTIVARAALLAGFVGAIRSLRFIISAESRAALVTKLHVPYASEDLLVAGIAVGVACSLAISGIAMARKRHWQEVMGDKVATNIQRVVAERFQAELLGGSYSKDIVGRLYNGFSNSFEPQTSNTMKIAATNVSEICGALAIATIIIAYLALQDVVLAIIAITIILAYSTYAVSHAYKDHITRYNIRKVQRGRSRGEVGTLLAEFIAPDHDVNRNALDKFHRIKSRAKVGAEAGEKANSVTGMIRRFFTEPVNAMIIITSPMFIYIILHSYYVSQAQNVDVFSIFISVILTRFLGQYSTMYISQSRSFALKYKNIRICYFIIKENAAVVPFMNSVIVVSPDEPEGRDEE
ncbi:MAG: hypothetical protein WDZ83_09065 [Rhizobiaceae bacterium]